MYVESLIHRDLLHKKFNLRLFPDGFFVPHGYLSDDEGDEDCGMTDEAKNKRLEQRKQQVTWSAFFTVLFLRGV